MFSFTSVLHHMPHRTFVLLLLSLRCQSHSVCPTPFSPALLFMSLRSPTPHTPSLPPLPVTPILPSKSPSTHKHLQSSRLSSLDVLSRLLPRVHSPMLHILRIRRSQVRIHLRIIFLLLKKQIVSLRTLSKTLSRTNGTSNATR